VTVYTNQPTNQEADELSTFSKDVAALGLLRGAERYYNLDVKSHTRKPGMDGVVLNNFPHTKTFIHALVKQVRSQTTSSMR
jgi:hypothetical protein